MSGTAYNPNEHDEDRGLPADTNLLPAIVCGVCFLGLLTFGLIYAAIKVLT